MELVYRQVSDGSIPTVTWFHVIDQAEKFVEVMVLPMPTSVSVLERVVAKEL